MGKETARKRLPKTRRAKTAPPIQITDRDASLIEAVLKFRFVEAKHLASLFCEDSQQGIYRRLKLLYHHKYLDRLPLRTDGGGERFAYALAEKSARLLAQRKGIGREEIPWHRHLNKMTPANVVHYLVLVDFWVSLECALTKADGISKWNVLPGYKLAKPLYAFFRDKEGRRFKKSVVPDLVIELFSDNAKKSLFFVEIDRSTISTNRFGEKVEVYMAFHHSGGARERFGVPGFVVLTTVSSDKRMQSLANKAVSLKGRRGFWFAPKNDFAGAKILDRIWKRAVAVSEGNDDAVSILDIVAET